MSTRICSVHLSDADREEVLLAVRSLVPDCDLRYVVDEDGQGTFEATVRSDIERQSLATMIWSMVRPKLLAARQG